MRAGVASENLYKKVRIPKKHASTRSSWSLLLASFRKSFVVGTWDRATVRAPGDASCSAGTQQGSNVWILLVFLFFRGGGEPLPAQALHMKGWGANAVFDIYF